MDLQNAFYIIGIIVMSLMLLLVIALVVAVFVIRAKVTAIQHTINEKLSILGSITDKGQDAISKVKRMVGRSL